MGEFTKKAMEAFHASQESGRLCVDQDYFAAVEAALIHVGVLGKVAGSISASSGGLANVTYADAENPRAECVMQPDGSIASRPHVTNQSTYVSQMSRAEWERMEYLFIRTPSREELDKIAAAMDVPGKIEPMKNDRHGNHAMLAKMDPAEPFFVLRGQDALAATLVRDWADRAEAAGVPRDKIDNARQCARAMKNWPMKKIPD